METHSSSENSIFRQSVDQKPEERKKIQRPHSAKPRTSGFTEANKQPTQQRQKQSKQIFYKRESKTPKQRRFHDSESLMQEIHQLKTSYNQVKQENIVCKTKMSIYQKELLKQEQLIEKLARQVQEDQYLPAQQIRKSLHFEKSVKHQLSELKQALKVKTEEVEKYKKNIKNTRYQEMEQELQAHLNECTRLRHLLKDQIRFPQQQEQSHQEKQKLLESIEVQQQCISTLKKENIELNSIIKKMRDEKKILKKKVVKQKDQQTNLKEGYISKEKYVKIKKKLQQLKNDHISFIQQVSDKDKQIIELDKQLQEKSSYLQRIDMELKEKEKYLQELKNQQENEKTEKFEISNQKEKQINEIWREKIQLEEKNKQDEERVKSFENQNEKLKKEIAELKEKLQNQEEKFEIEKSKLETKVKSRKQKQDQIQQDYEDEKYKLQEKIEEGLQEIQKLKAQKLIQQSERDGINNKQIEEKEDQIRDLQYQLEQKESELEREIESFNQKISLKESEIQSIKKDLENTISKYQKQISSIEAQKLTSEQELNKVKQTYESQSEEIKVLQSEVFKKQQSIKDLQNQIQERQQSLQKQQQIIEQIKLKMIENNQNAKEFWQQSLKLQSLVNKQELLQALKDQGFFISEEGEQILMMQLYQLQPQNFNIKMWTIAFEGEAEEEIESKQPSQRFNEEKSEQELQESEVNYSKSSEQKIQSQHNSENVIQQVKDNKEETPISIETILQNIQDSVQYLQTPLKQQFQNLDGDRSNFVSYENFKEILQRNFSISDIQVQQLVVNYNLNSRGETSYIEFLKLLNLPSSPLIVYTEEMVIQKLKQFIQLNLSDWNQIILSLDVNQTDIVETSQFQSIVQRVGLNDVSLQLLANILRSINEEFQIQTTFEHLSKYLLDNLSTEENTHQDQDPSQLIQRIRNYISGQQNNIMHIFMLFDQSSVGYINENQFKDLLQHSQIQFSQNEINKLLQTYGTESKLSYKKFEELFGRASDQDLQEKSSNNHSEDLNSNKTQEIKSQEQVKQEEDISVQQIDQLTLQQIEQQIREKVLTLQQAFHNLDESSLGLVSLQEFKNVLSQHLILTLSQLEGLINSYELNNEGNINFKQFLQNFQNQIDIKEDSDQQIQDQEDQSVFDLIQEVIQAVEENQVPLNEIFNSLDINEDGFVADSEMQKVFLQLNLRMSLNQVQKIIKEFDKDKDRRITFKEFESAITKKMNNKNTQDSSQNSEKSQEILYETEDVKDIFEMIQLKMQMNRLEKNQFINILLNDIQNEEEITQKLLIKYVHQNLEISTQAQAYKLSSFLCDNKKKQKTKLIIKKALDHLQDWKVISEEEEFDLDNTIRQILIQNQEFIMNECLKEDQSKTGVIDKGKFHQIATKVGLDAFQINFLDVLFYSSTFDIYQAPYEKLIQAYCLQDQDKEEVQQEQDEDDEIELTEQERNKIFFSCMTSILNQLLSKNLKLFQAFDQQMNPQEFQQCLINLNIDFTEVEFTVIFRSLASKQDEDYVNLQDIISQFTQLQNNLPQIKEILYSNSEGEQEDKISEEIYSDQFSEEENGNSEKSKKSSSRSSSSSLSSSHQN